MGRYIFRQDTWDKGMSPDEYGGKGTCDFSTGVNVRKSRYSFKLSEPVGTPLSRTDSGDLSPIIAGIINSSSDQAWVSNIKVYDFLLEELFVPNTGTTMRNAGTVTNDVGSAFGFIITDTKLHRWPIVNGMMSGSSIISDTSFDTPGSWTCTGGWSITGGSAVNSSGSAGSVSQVSTSAASKYYRISITHSISSGDFTVKMGGSTIGTISGTGTTSVYRYTAGTNETFSIESSAGEIGSINQLSVYISNVTEEVVSFTSTGSGSNRPYNKLGERLYIGVGSSVRLVNCLNSGWTLDSTVNIEIGRDQTIVAITRVGDLFIVYATSGSSGYQYFWDGVSDAPERVIQWYDLPITNVANFGNYDYVVCADNNGRKYLYQAIGYQKSLIAQSGYEQSPSIKRFGFDSVYTNAIETVGEVLLVPSENERDGRGIYAYGKYHPNYDKCISKDFNGITGFISALYNDSVNSAYLFVATQSVATKRLYKIPYPISGSSFCPSGYIETNSIIGNTGEAQKKTAVKVRLGIKLPHSSTSAKLYMSKDDGAYSLLKTISTSSSFVSEDTTTIGDDFHKAKFKIELLTSNSTYSPEVFGFELEYENANNQLGY